MQLDLERVTVCVNALGWTLEIQEPLGVTMQELCSPALDVPGAGGSL